MPRACGPITTRRGTQGSRVTPTPIAVRPVVVPKNQARGAGARLLQSSQTADLAIGGVGSCSSCLAMVFEPPRPPPVVN